MTVQRETVQTCRCQLHGSLVILKKNARLYYLKPPVLIFGILFPAERCISEYAISVRYEYYLRIDKNHAKYQCTK